jgi:very-short-patch-repair endonuclease
MSSVAGLNVQFMDIPFRGSVALRSGELTRNDLRTRFRPIFRDVYFGRDADMTAALKARAAWLSTGATLCGVSAAAVHGTKWLPPHAPAEIVRANPYPQKGMVVRRYQLTDHEVCLARSMRVTTPARTAFDLGRHCSLEVGVQRIDALMNATDVKVDDVLAVVEQHPGVRGLRQLRQTLALVDGGAESPQETRVRLLLMSGGIPKPQTQLEFRDLHIRVDMGWREWKVAVEYDGIQHWQDSRQRSWDIERLALLEAAGWIVIRVSAEMLKRPQVIVDRVGRALISRGCPGT